jgi:hypothetical protein
MLRAAAVTRPLSSDDQPGDPDRALADAIDTVAADLAL